MKKLSRKLVIVLPFMEPIMDNYHGNEKYLFWPDLASAHFDNRLDEWMSIILAKMDLPYVSTIQNFLDYL